MTTPQALLLMRHAEKPDDKSDPDLSAAGLERAKNLPGRIQAILCEPVQFIFAARRSAHSNRAVETVTPLSLSVGVNINSDVADKDYAVLAKQILNEEVYDGKRIVVCWHHDNLADLAATLGAAPQDYPGVWPGTVFDLVLVFKWDAGELSVTQSWDDAP
jgi:phosphohistidine phosphatase SixA